MPKLTKVQAQAVEASEVIDMGPLPVGNYRALLETVEVKESKQGSDYWKCTFKLTEPESQNRKMWVNLSLNPKAEWKMKEFFLAMGFSTDSDTEEMEGEECMLTITIKTIDQGDKTGEKTNEVVRMFALEESEAASPEAASKGF